MSLSQTEKECLKSVLENVNGWSSHQLSGREFQSLEASHSFTCTATRSSAIGMSHACLCLPSYNWYSFTDPGGIKG